MKDLRKFYAAMGGMPVIKTPPVRFKDESFRVYGRQVPRTPNFYKWGQR